MKTCLTFIALTFFLLCLSSCNRKYKKELIDAKSQLDNTKNQLDSCILNKGFQANFLNLLNETGIPKTFNKGFKSTLRFNLDLNEKKPQVIHISSDRSKIPFMILCKVDGTQRGDKFTFSKLDLAVRSIGKTPVSFFKIKGVPTLELYNHKGYKYKLTTFIDLNTSGSSPISGRTRIAKPCETVNKKELIEVEINPKYLKESLDSIRINSQNLPLYFDEKFIKEIDKFCCAGVICSLNLLM
ncbi:hypothetical protein [Aquimarina sp. 2304DJ70-9]|uniref:hypothetical protein n=1 Tax=Aquimarina penaris TaxID=3231044 RepID=UPI0034636310